MTGRVTRRTVLAAGADLAGSGVLRHQPGELCDVRPGILCVRSIILE